MKKTAILIFLFVAVFHVTFFIFKINSITEQKEIVKTTEQKIKMTQVVILPSIEQKAPSPSEFRKEIVKTTHEIEQKIKPIIEKNQKIVKKEVKKISKKDESFKQIVEKEFISVENKEEIKHAKSDISISNEPTSKELEELKQKNLLDEQKKQEILNQYLAQITEYIQKNKTYPNTARRLKQTGVVELHFIIEKNGEIKNLSVKNSSNSSYLDSASIDMIKKIGSFNPIPKELEKNSIEIVVPIEYKLI
ncbi:MAG: TonB family protein [Campylobacterales bacterium]|nr:TonB family protein [Campylobacterales bacterium]